MNELIALFKRLLKTVRGDANPIETPDNSTHTAAVPAQIEPQELHHGRRRLKENYTSHWDLDYLPRKDMEEIMAEPRSSVKTQDLPSKKRIPSTFDSIIDSALSKITTIYKYIKQIWSRLSSELFKFAFLHSHEYQRPLAQK